VSRLIESCHLSKLDFREVLDTYTQFWLGAILPDKEQADSPHVLTIQLPA